ncbi:MAG: cell division protein ZapA [Prevotella sp.]
METEMNRMSVNVFGHEFEVHVPKEKEPLYLSAAEYANNKIDAYMDAFVRIPLPQKSTQEILLMAMLDIAVDSIECKQSNENCSFFGKIKYILKSFASKGMNTVRA